MLRRDIAQCFNESSTKKAAGRMKLNESTTTKASRQKQGDENNSMKVA
jgi:hypothetical protein